MKHFLRILAVLLATITICIQTENEAHAGTFSTTVSEVASGPYNSAFEVDITFGIKVSNVSNFALDVWGTANPGGFEDIVEVTNVGTKPTKTWRATITPTRSGELTVMMSADAVRQGEDSNATSNHLDITIDMDRPTVVKFTDLPDPKWSWIGAQKTTAMTHNPKNTLAYKVHYNEDVTLRESFVEDDTGFEYSFSGSGKVHTVSVDFHGNPEDLGGLRIWAGEHWATDTAGNSSLGKIDERTVYFDTEGPTVDAFDWPEDGEVVGEYILEIYCRDDKTDFNEYYEELVVFKADDIILGGTATATITDIETDLEDDEHAFTVTPTTDGTVTFQVKADVIHDWAGNGNLASEVIEWNVDVTPPTVELTVPEGPQTGAFDITATFSEPVHDFTADDVTVNGPAAATALSANADNSVYTVTITPNATSEGDVTFQIAADVVTDKMGLNNTASDVTNAVPIDTLGPTATITNVPTTAQSTPFDITITFNEEVDGFSVAHDLAVRGNVGAFLKETVTPKKQFTVTLAPIANQERDITVQVKANTVTDAAGNGNPASDRTSVRVDTIAPTVTISPTPTAVQKGPFDLTVTFSESVNGFTIPDDLTIVGEADASLRETVTPKKKFTVTLTPRANQEGNVTVEVKAYAVTDAAENYNTDSVETLAVRIDTLAPTVTMSTPPTGAQKDPFDLTLTFSEVVNGFAVADDLAVTGPATASLKATVTPDKAFTVAITPNPNQEGDVTVQLKANAVTDAVGNHNAAADVTPPVRVDTVGPSVKSITGLPTTAQGAPFDITVTFSEPVNDFTADDVTVNGPAAATALSASADNSVYTVTIAPTATSFEGSVTFQVKAGVATDNLGNGNTASAVTTAVPIDTLAPTATITGVPTAKQNAAFDLTVTFDEAVSGFTAPDALDITGAATASLKATVTPNRVYTVAITPNPNQEGDVTVAVKANAVTDTAGNNNTASAVTPPVPIDTLGPTVKSFTGLPTTAQRAPFDITITFSEAVNGFTMDDVVVEGGAAATAVSGSDGDTAYKVTITPNANTEANIIVQVKADAVTDNVENSNTASAATPHIRIDTIAPVLWSTAAPGGKNVPFDATFVFSEPVNGFTVSDLGDFVHATATLKSGSDGDARYVVTFTPKPTTQGDIVFRVLANAVQDLAGNGNTDLGKVGAVWIDNVVPEIVSIEVKKDTETFPLSITITFSEHVTDFTVDDVIVTGPATVRVDPGSGGHGRGYWDNTYVLGITPDPNSEGEVTVQLRADAVQDQGGNHTVASDVKSIGRVDTRPPTVTITEVPTGVQLAAFSVNIEFSEDVTGFELTDITLSGDAVVESSVLTAESEKAWTLTITPHEDTDGDVTITVPADVAIDAALNNNAASAPQTVSVAPAWIPDANLRAAIRVALGLAAGADFSRAQLAVLKTLTVPLAVTDFTGLEHATNLTSINVKNSQITSLKALARATKLTALDLSDNDITDITSLQHLTGLIKLDLSGNNITDITPLAGLTNLTTLILSDNDITDITSLQYLTNLTTLVLGDNAITDISPLEDLTNLTILGINSNPISSLDPVKVLTSLTTLELSGNALSDLSTLSGLTGLQRLYLTDNAITSSGLNAITGLTALTHLDLSKNKVTGLTALANFTQLINLSLNDNDITDVNPLATLTTLEYLYLVDNAIVDVEPLTGLANLKVLWLEGNPIVNTAPLYPLTQRVPPVDIDITVEKGLEAEDGFDAKLDIDIPGAPSAMDIFTHLDRATLEALDPASLKATLDRLRLESDGSQKYLHAIKLLQNVLAQLLPEETRLLANYPNPFNPETWIPYQLAKGSDVEIFIYDARGVLVRHLALGHQHAGYYTEKSRAAYWDGRNSIGERVASGIYFYRLQAENTSLLRKMLILK